MIVERCMTKSPRVCTGADTLSTVARMLWEHDIGVLPVVDQAGGVVGVITDRDVCMAAYTTGQPLHACTVARHMSRTVFTIGAKADTAKAAELMGLRKVRRLPVVENGRLVGMITLSDLARNQGREARSVVGTLAAISAPTSPAPAVPKTGKIKSVNRPTPRALTKKR